VSDIATRNEDWLKTIRWSVPAIDMAELLDFLDVADQPDATQRSAVESFTKLPAFEPAPRPLITEVRAFLARPVALTKEYNPDQPREADGRWGSGGSGAAATAVEDRPQTYAERQVSLGAEKLSSKSAEFTAAGGTVHEVTGAEQEKALADVTAMQEWAHGQPGYTDHIDSGFHMTIEALGGGEEFHDDSSPDRTLVARSADGSIAGAMNMTEYPARSDWQGTTPAHVEMHFIGTTGIVPGAGSALATEALRSAASRDEGAVLVPLRSAQSYWSGMGAHSGGLGPLGEPFVVGWSPNEVKQMVGQ
jgi:hypothetical protein